MLKLFFQVSCSQSPITTGFCKWHSVTSGQKDCGHNAELYSANKEGFHNCTEDTRSNRVYLCWFSALRIQLAFPMASVFSAPDEQKEFTAGWVLFSSKMKGICFLPEECFQFHSCVLKVSYGSTSNLKFELELKDFFWSFAICLIHGKCENTFTSLLHTFSYFVL